MLSSFPLTSATIDSTFSLAPSRLLMGAANGSASSSLAIFSIFAILLVMKVQNSAASSMNCRGSFMRPCSCDEEASLCAFAAVLR